MRPWVQWCIDHHLRGLLLVVLVVVGLPVALWVGLREATANFMMEYTSIMNQPRSKQ